MYLHISFTDGSNPYVYYSDKHEDINEELIRWGKNYVLKPIKLTTENPKGYFFTASDKLLQKGGAN